MLNATLVRRLALVPLAVLVACGPTAIAGGDDDEATSEHADGRSLVQVFEPRRSPRVDLVLVVDDSPSMLNFQADFAANLAGFADVMEADDVAADIRIAVTSSSVPGPTCTGARARGGEPLIDSCRAHVQDFIGPDEHGELGGEIQDLRDVCESACGLETITRIPSPGADEHDHENLALRPWIEAPQNPFGGNLPDGVELTEALTCAGLQGFTGCRYESPIEAAARMVEHMRDPNHPMFEFRRPNAFLQFVFIGDEDDCSHPDASATIFDPAGDRTFWPDPLASEAPSAVCVNAGLACDGDGCALTGHTLAGAPTSDPSLATLTSPNRLREALEAAGEYDVEPWIPLIAAVGGYTNSGSINYAQPGPDDPPEDHDYAAAYGVGPGCSASAGRRAAPGGRLAQATTPGEVYSICEPDWTPAFAGWAPRIKDILIPWCMEFACVEDLDPTTDLLEPDCVLEQVDIDGHREPLPQCVRDGDGWRIDAETSEYVLPEGADTCWVWRTDATGASDDPFDDTACSYEELSGEIAMTWRQRTYLPYDSVYELRCRPCAG